MGRQKPGLFGKGLNYPEEETFEIMVWKRDIDEKQHFLLFLQCVLHFQMEITII